MGKRDDVPAVQKAQEVLDYFAGVNREQMSDIERDACQLAEAVLRAPASEGEALKALAVVDSAAARCDGYMWQGTQLADAARTLRDLFTHPAPASEGEAVKPECSCVGSCRGPFQSNENGVRCRLATHPAPASEGEAWVQAMLEAEALEMLKYFGAHDLHSNKDYKAAAEGFASRVAVALATNSATETVAGASNAVEKLHDLAQQMSGNPYATMYSHILTEIAESIATHPAPATVTEAMVEAGAKALVVGVNGLTEKGWENKDGDSWIEAVKAQAKKEMREVLLAALGGAR